MTASLDGTLGVTFPDSSVQNTAATNFGFKNKFINGAMQIAQRATSGTSGSAVPTTSPATYPCVDRWFAYATGATVTVSQGSGTGANKNTLSVAGAASVTAVGVGQRIEQLNSYDLASSTCTLSCYISNSLLTTVNWTASYATTADTWTTKTQIATGTFTVTSTRTQYTTNISIPAAATTGIEILFTVGAQISGTWVLDSIQLEKGSTATVFDYRPYGTELALCQRYFQQWDGSGPVCMAYGNTANTNLVAVFPLKVTMRTAPTGITVSSAGAFSIGNVVGTTSAIAFSAGNKDAVTMVVTNSGTYASLTASQLKCDASAQITFTGSEL